MSNEQKDEYVPAAPPTDVTASSGVENTSPKKKGNKKSLTSLNNLLKRNAEKYCDPEIMVADTAIYKIPLAEAEFSELIVTETITKEECGCDYQSEVRIHSTDGNTDVDQDSVNPTMLCFKSEEVKREIKTWTRHQKKIIEPSAECHNTQDGIKGPFLIFNYKHFSRDDCRQGANKITMKMAKTAIYLGFSPVRIYNDLDKSKTTKLLEEIGKCGFDDVNCIGCYASSHGDSAGQYYYYRDSSSMQDFENYIGGNFCDGGCVAPRLFFYDTCLGLRDGGSKADAVGGDGVGVNFFNSSSTPTSADVLSVYSTTYGDVSYRGIFVTALCEVLTENCDNELSEIIMKLNSKMATYGARNRDGKIVKQMPTPINKMTKPFYFFRLKSHSDTTGQ